MESVAVNNRPELPALESVEASLWGDVSLARMRADRAFLALFLFAMADIMLYLLGIVAARVAKEGAASYGYARLFILAPIVAVLGFVAIYHLVRVIRSDIYWKTDSRGLQAYRLIGSRFLAWEEVTDVHTSKSSLGFVSHAIQSGRFRFLIPDGSDKRANLAASVWQHLNRLGKAENMTLTDESASFWEPIPEVVPLEMDLQITTVPCTCVYSEEFFRCCL